MIVEDSLDDYEAAVAALERHGRKALGDAAPGTLGRGQAIGLAVAHALAAPEAADAAAAVLEHWNYHLAAAALAAVLGGSATRSGRRLELLLPREWGPRGAVEAASAADLHRAIRNAVHALRLTEGNAGLRDLAARDLEAAAAATGAPR